MDGGTAATAPPSHSHHLESPLCHAPPSPLPPNVDCCVLPPPPTAARRRQHPDIVIALLLLLLLLLLVIEVCNLQRTPPGRHRRHPPSDENIS